MSEFKNLDIRDHVACFGFTQPKAECWMTLLKKTQVFKELDKAKLEKSLTDDVELSYYRLASFHLVDLDTDIEYNVFYMNDKKAWDVEIPDSPQAEISIDDKIKMFHSDFLKKLVTQADTIMSAALEMAKDPVKGWVLDGSLLKVDEAKFEALLDHYLVDQTTRANFKKCVYLK